MSEQVKLIWDFRGPNAQHIAQHHAKHFKEYAEAKNMATVLIGSEAAGPMHHLAYMVVEEVAAHELRNILKPNRGQWYRPE